MALQRQACIKGEKRHAIKSLLCDMCACIYNSILCNKFIYVYLIISTIIVIIIIMMMIIVIVIVIIIICKTYDICTVPFVSPHICYRKKTCIF